MTPTHRAPFASSDAAAQSATPAPHTEPSSTPATHGIGRFRPRARLLKSLGEELISSETVAILELVRNCYDADASRVEIRFDHLSDPDAATLEIQDNGHGMTQDILLGPWLEPATDHKAERSGHHPRKEGDTTPSTLGSTGGVVSPGGRRRLGSKGVGRFATQRLGQTLKVHTCPRVQESPAYALEAHFDWTGLESQEPYLDQLEIPWRRVHDLGQTPGTLLRIGTLRDDWTDERFERLRIGLSRLISPALEGQTFQLVLRIQGADETIRPVIDRQRAMFGLTGQVDEGGRARLTYTDLNGTRETWERTLTWPPSGQTCGPMVLQLSAWDLDRQALEPFLQRTGGSIKPREFRRLLKEHAGISLYRDGFRILPYGEPDNDWLRLDRRRVNNPTLRFSNNQLLGWIQLSASGNPHLNDQTNREGLVDNAAYRHLQAIVIELLSMLEMKRAQARRAVTHAPKKSTPLPSLQTHAQVEVERLLEGLERGKEARSSIRALREQLQVEREERQTAIQQYAGLASGGAVSAQLYAQLLPSLKKLKHELNMVQADLKLEEPGLIPDCCDGITLALKEVETLQLRLQQLDPFVSGRGARKLERWPVGSGVRAVLALFDDRLASLQIDVALVEKKPVEWVVRGECVQQALVHVLDNACYWLGRKAQLPRILRVEVEDTQLTVANNGPAFEPGLLSRLFDPYISCKPEGAGMGLSLARTLLETTGMRIHAEETPFGPAFVIEA